MEHRVSRIEDDLKEIQRKLEFHSEMIGKHEVACEVNAPKAQSAHDGMIHMSTELAVVSEALKTVVRAVDTILEDGKQANLDRADTKRIIGEIQVDIAEAKGEKNGESVWASWIKKGFYTSSILFVLWTANEIRTIQLQLAKEETHNHPKEKAINPSKVSGKIKKDKEAQK